MKFRPSPATMALAFALLACASVPPAHAQEVSDQPSGRTTEFGDLEGPFVIDELVPSAATAPSGSHKIDVALESIRNNFLVPLGFLPPLPSDLPLPPSAKELKESACAISVRTLVDGYRYDRDHPGNGLGNQRAEWNNDARMASTVVEPAVSALNAAVAKISPETRRWLASEMLLTGQMHSTRETFTRRKLIEGLKRDLGPSLGMHATETAPFCENRDMKLPTSLIGEVKAIAHDDGDTFREDDNDPGLCFRFHKETVFGPPVRQTRPMANAIAKGYELSIDTETGALELKTFAESPVEAQLQAYRTYEPLQPKQVGLYEMNLARLALTPSKPLTPVESQLWKPLNEPAPISLTEDLLNSLKKTCGKSVAYRDALRDERANLNYDKGPAAIIHTDEAQLLKASGVAR